jgi:hypothetical protein
MDRAQPSGPVSKAQTEVRTHPSAVTDRERGPRSSPTATAPMPEQGSGAARVPIVPGCPGRAPRSSAVASLVGTLMAAIRSACADPVTPNIDHTGAHAYGRSAITARSEKHNVLLKVRPSPCRPAPHASTALPPRRSEVLVLGCTCRRSAWEAGLRKWALPGSNGRPPACKAQLLQSTAVCRSSRSAGDEARLFAALCCGLSLPRRFHMTLLLSRESENPEAWVFVRGGSPVADGRDFRCCLHAVAPAPLLSSREATFPPDSRSATWRGAGSSAATAARISSPCRRRMVARSKHSGGMVENDGGRHGGRPPV